MVEMTKESITLKNVKVAHHMSEETTAFTATLHINGKKAAYVKNEGRGGDNYPRFLNRELETEFHEFCATLPVVKDEWHIENNIEPSPMDYDSFIGDLLTEWMENDDWKKACRKGLVFLLKDGPPGAYRITNGKYSAILAEKIREKHGDNLLEIVNERFL
jgi:hypothetical protein